MRAIRFLTLTLAAITLTTAIWAGSAGQVSADTSAMGAPATAPAANSLYKRLGGYDAIAAVTDDFIVRLATDKQMSRFFVGLSDGSKQHVRQMVVDLICAKTGGPCYYLGRDMRTAHAGLHITEDDWNRSVDALKASLNKFNVGAKEQSDLFAIIAPLKSDIVGR